MTLMYPSRKEALKQEVEPWEEEGRTEDGIFRANCCCVCEGVMRVGGELLRCDGV